VPGEPGPQLGTGCRGMVVESASIRADFSNVE
jgi:hypothetical protein